MFFDDKILRETEQALKINSKRFLMKIRYVILFLLNYFIKLFLNNYNCFEILFDIIKNEIQPELGFRLSL